MTARIIKIIINSVLETDLYRQRNNIINNIN